MKKISAGKYVEGVMSIYVEQPDYQTGHDGSDGMCDCIGMCRGGLKRGGATDVKGMNGTNYAARHTIQNLQELQSSQPLIVGDVVLKTRDKDDKNMPLPDQYRKGGNDYSERWGETNFTHIGTVTQVNPLVITHMTSPKPKEDKSIKGWGYFGELPWIEYEAAPEPPPEPPFDPDPEPDPEKAIVVAESGNTVKMRARPTQSCNLYWDVPIGAEVDVYEWDASTDKKGQVWSEISWAGQTGYMIRKFLRDEDEEETPEIPPDPPGTIWIVIIPGLSREQAEALVTSYPGASMEEGSG